MKLSALKVDAAQIEQGRWVEDIPDLAGIRLKVRGIGNTDYRRLFDRKVEAVPRAQRLRGLSPEDRDRIVGECLHEAVLLDWDGFTEDDDTTPLPYSAETAKALLLDPNFARFRAGVAWAGGLVAEEASADVADDAKNSRTRLPGN